MASTHAKAVRRAGALRRLSDRLGVQPADLHANAKGDAEMALIMTLERLADALDAQGGQADEEPPVTVETVKEEPLKTTETVEIVPAEDAPAAKPKGKAK